MRYIIILLFCTGLYAEIVKMDDGSCYERKGKLNYITPCPSKKPPKETKTAQGNHTGQSAGVDQKCLFKIGDYSAEYLKSKTADGEAVSCGDSREYIDAMSLGYDASLKKNKLKIGDVIVKKGLAKCKVELYYGDYMTIGFMSGDRLMCDDFMVHHGRLNSRRR